MRQRETKRETKTERDKGRDREGDKERETKTERERGKQRETKPERGKRDKDRERDKERGATDLLQVSPSPCWTAGSKEKEGRRMERETGKRGKNTSALPITFDLLKTVGV